MQKQIPGSFSDKIIPPWLLVYKVLIIRTYFNKAWVWFRNSCLALVIIISTDEWAPDDKLWFAPAISHQSIRQKEKPVMYCIATRVLVSAGECVASCAVCWVHHVTSYSNVRIERDTYFNFTARSQSSCDQWFKGENQPASASSSLCRMWYFRQVVVLLIVFNIHIIRKGCSTSTPAKIRMVWRSGLHI